MNNELRRIHHLTKEESSLVLHYRLLPPELKHAIADMAERLANNSAAQHENVVRMVQRMRQINPTSITKPAKAGFFSS